MLTSKCDIAVCAVGRWGQRQQRCICNIHIPPTTGCLTSDQLNVCLVWTDKIYYQRSCMNTAYTDSTVTCSLRLSSQLGVSVGRDLILTVYCLSLAGRTSLLL